MASSRRTSCNWCECDTKSCCDCWVSERHTLLTELYFLLLATLAPSSTLCWFASDTPVVQSCQSVTRQSEEPRQYILCSPNTVNTEYISAPNTHVWLAHCIPTYSTNTKFWSATILAEYNSRIEARRLLHSSFLRTIASIALSSQMSIAPIFYDMTHPKKSPLIWLRKSGRLQYYDHHFNQSGRSVNPFQPSWEC